MKKMFLKKLICLLLSLSFSLSPVLSDLVTFSSDSCECFWGISPLDLGAGISKKKAEDEESSDEEPNDQEPDVDDWDLDRKANEAAIEAKEAQKEALKHSSEGSFINLWNRLVEKYVFDKSSSKGLPFKGSDLYLEEDTEITVYLAYALYSLADKLLNHIELIDAEDFVYVVAAKEVSEEFLIEKNFYNYSNNLFPCDFFADTWDSRANKSVADAIYEKIIEVREAAPTIRTVNVYFKGKEVTDFWKNQIPLSFVDLWKSVMDCFVFDKVHIYMDGEPALGDKMISSCKEVLVHLNIDYVRILHEFAIKLRACKNLYSEFFLPYLNAAIELSEEIAKEEKFDLPDNFVGNLSNNIETKWEDPNNRKVLIEIFNIISIIKDRQLEFLRMQRS